MVPDERPAPRVSTVPAAAAKPAGGSVTPESAEAFGGEAVAVAIHEPPAVASRRGVVQYYLALWRSVPRELVAHALALPLAFVGLVVVSVVSGLAVALLGVLVGALLVPAALYLARAVGTAEIERVRFSGVGAVRRPDWQRRGGPVPPPGYALYGPVIDGHYWLYVLHSLVVGPLVGAIVSVVALAWFWAGIGTLGLGLVQLASGDSSTLRGPTEWMADAVYTSAGMDAAPEPVVMVASIVTTVMFVATLPFVTRGLAIVTLLVDSALLGPWRSEALQREVADLSASRGAAVIAEDVALRRLERDIHDGPQQRLIRIQMDLAAAERRIDSDPESARGLVIEARDHVRLALDELRALSRGVAPPILQDRGLLAAVRSLAEMSTVPVEVEAGAAEGVLLPSAVERSAYFVVAELLTNVAKHAEADSARVHLAVRPATADSPDWLDIWVVDDGRGGVVAVPGHGLDGIGDRVRGLRGVFVVDSPIGGPSVVGVHIPFVRPVEVPR